MAISKNINLEKLFSTKGQFLSAKWQSKVPTSAKYKKDVTIVKVTEAVVRAGINFANLTSVKTAIENNERELQPLKWGQWLKFPYIIGHKDKRYIRLYPSKNKPKVKYFINGIEVKKAMLEKYLTPSKWKELNDNTKKDIECFSVSEENIISLH